MKTRRIMTSCLVAMTLMANHALSASKPLRFLIGHVFVPPEDKDAQDAFRASVERAFSIDTRVKLLTVHDITKWKTANAPKAKSNSTGSELVEARRLLLEGKNLYQKIKYEEALVRLLAARRELILNLHLLRSNRDLLEAHLYLGMTFAVLGESQKASEEFKRVVYLDPKRELSGKEYPPSALKAFAKARQDVMNAMESKVEIISENQGSDVYLNGRLAGQTPLNINLHVGEYFILVEKGDQEPWYQTMAIQGPADTIHAGEMKTELAQDALFRVREANDQASEDLAELFTYANGVAADFVVLATLQKLENYRLLGQLLEVKTGRFSNVSLAELEGGLAGFDRAASDTAKTLLSFLTKDGKLLLNPNLSDSETSANLSVGEKPTNQEQVMKPIKPWYKKWWIYPVIVGAGAAVYLGATKLGGKGGSKVIFDNSGNN
ncbi:MAG: PEGA domain-containing protein [Bdellovibrionales bacterium]|nr:PEGA domain-containing protein [Bdellovibrionales bacterium]